MTDLTKTQIIQLIEVWKTLNTLTVSLDRIGTFQAFHGEQKGKEALSEYFEPKLVRRIAASRRMVTSILESADATLLEKMGDMADDEEAMGYWDGLKDDRI
jgi:hypothetical protein